MSMVNNFSCGVKQILGTTSNPSSTFIGIIDRKNPISSELDENPSLVQIMWYRFLLIIIIFVTAAGNILVCLAIAKERKLQNTTNYFLMSLAVADCLVAVLVMPIGMVSEVLGYFPLPHYGCIIFATMDVLCCTSSIWHMSTMSMDRYFTIRFPFRYGRNKTRRIMLLKIVAVWAISAAVSSPVFVLGIVNKENVLSGGVCAPNNASFKIYGSIFAFYIPFLIMITTYALTMRSLRNVLVNKKKYSRERNRKQTFFPIAHVINQYAEITDNIRRASSSFNPVPSSGLTTALVNSSSSTSTGTTNNNLSMNKSPYSIVTSPAALDLRTQMFPLNNHELKSKQDISQTHYGTINLNNGNSINHDPHQHDIQHLTISYRRPIIKRKRRHRHHHSQPPVPMNECDMSTVYEITEYSKSTSSTHDVSALIGNSLCRKSAPSGDQLHYKNSPTLRDTMEQMSLANSTQKASAKATTNASTINTISTLEEEEVSSTTDADSAMQSNELIQPSTEFFTNPITFNPLTSVSLVDLRSLYLIYSWRNYLRLLPYIVHYYLFVFPYRSRPLTIQYSSEQLNSRDNRVLLAYPTSSSTQTPIPVKNSRSVATQTNFCNISEYYFDNLPQRKTSTHRDLVTSPSLLTNIFRQSSTTNLGSLEYSSNSLAGSTSCQVQSLYPPNQHHQSSSNLRAIEPEFEQVLMNDHRPRASSSSSGLVQTLPRHSNHASSHWHLPLRRKQNFKSHSAYIATNPSTNSLRHYQQYASTTNTNSSDSSSVFYRFNPKLFSTSSHQTSGTSSRLRDEHTVAANERKALRVLMIIFCVFVTLWTPFFICTFITAICDQCRERISSDVWFSITWLGYSSSMANPFIYTIFSDVFRRAFTNIILCRTNDSFISRQYSTKFSCQRLGGIQNNLQHQTYSRRQPPYEYSGQSATLPLHHPTPISGSDMTIYVNRCASESFR